MMAESMECPVAQNCKQKYPLVATEGHSWYTLKFDVAFRKSELDISSLE